MLLNSCQHRYSTTWKSLERRVFDIYIQGLVVYPVIGHMTPNFSHQRHTREEIIDRVKETYYSELGGKNFAYDGEKSLFTAGSLPRNKLEFVVVLGDISSNRFSLKQRGNTNDVEPQTLELTVYDYFTNNRNIELRYSDELPCINVGKPKRPTYIPVELCLLVSLQRYTKALTTFQRSSLVEKSSKSRKKGGVYQVMLSKLIIMGLNL